MMWPHKICQKNPGKVRGQNEMQRRNANLMTALSKYIYIYNYYLRPAKGQNAIKVLHFFTVESPGKHIGYGFSRFETSDGFLLIRLTLHTITSLSSLSA